LLTARSQRREALREEFPRRLGAPDELYERLVGRPYEQVIAWLHRRIDDAPDQPDLHAVALALIESISAYHSMRHTFGRAPDDVDDERFIAGWVETALAVARRFGLS
jgi:hypothetical protein